ASSAHKLHMRGGPSRLALIDVGGNLEKKPYCFIGECSRDVERCLTNRAPVASLEPRAQPQLLFCFFNQSLLMLALWSWGRRAASSKRSGKSTGFCWPRAPRSNPWLEPIYRLRL